MGNCLNTRFPISFLLYAGCNVNFKKGSLNGRNILPCYRSNENKSFVRVRIYSLNHGILIRYFWHHFWNQLKRYLFISKILTKFPKTVIIFFYYFLICVLCNFYNLNGSVLSTTIKKYILKLCSSWRRGTSIWINYIFNIFISSLC